MRNTVNATASETRKMAIERIGNETGLGNKLVRQKTSVKRTTQTEIVAKVNANKARVPLTQYSPKITFKGTRGTVHADVSMLRQRQVISNKTFANPKNPTKIMRRRGQKAYPVFSPTGPSVVHHWTRIKDETIKIANELLVKNFTEKLQAQIEKRK